MPHIIVEYSNNLRDDLDIPAVLLALSTAVRDQSGEDGRSIYPLAGLRARAVGYEHYRIADAAADYGFVHVTIKVGAGRSEAIEKKTAADAFSALNALLAPVAERRLVAISLVLERFSEAGTLKNNNIHAHLRKLRA